MHHQGRRTSVLQCLGVQDPLAPAAQLPPTAASEIVKAARAYLQDPTRPVTPAESSRHLLQSSCGYSNRPSTSAGCVGSNEFLTAAVSDGLCWDGRSSSRSNGGQADVWVAEAEPDDQASSCRVPAGTQVRSQRVTGSLPGLSRAPVLTPMQPTQQPLPHVSRADLDSSSRRGLAASAGGVSTGSRLAELGTLVPLRPATAQQAAQDTSVPVTPSEDLVLGADTGVVQHVAVSLDVNNSSSIQDSWQYLNRAPSEAGTCGLGPEGSDSVLAGREASTSTENSSVVRLGSVGGPSSRGSTAGSSCSRSRLSSRGSERCSKPTAQDSMSAEEAELDQLLLEEDATEGPSAAGIAALQQGPCQAAAASSKQWQQSVLSILEQIQALSLSPTDAPALLQRCSQLQCLLDTAADWGCLQDWLHPAPLQMGAGQLQPCVSRNLSSGSRAICGSGGREQGRLQVLAELDLQATLLQTLVRLVDSRKPDVLVKVGAMLLGITPAESHLLLPATKMLYTLSKDSCNDSRFRHHGVLRPLLQMTAMLSGLLEQRRQQQHTSTALLYCSGCLKNLSADGTNQKSLGRLGGVMTLAQVLFDQVAIAEAVAAAQQQAAPEQHLRHPQHETAAQISVQAAAVLRNLSVSSCNAPIFTQQSCAPLHALISLLQPFRQDQEVLLNASRCLSKLSLYEGCRQGLLSAYSPPQCLEGIPGGSNRGSSAGGAPPSVRDSWGLPNCPSSGSSTQPRAVACMVRALLSVQATQPKQWPMAIRLAFALGQLTTYHPESRQQAAAVAGVLDALPRLVLDLLQFSKLRQQAQPHVQQQGPHCGQLGLAEDLVTKLLRLLANLAIDRTVGATLAARQTIADALVAVLTGYEYEAAEELVLNATAALANLAFYDKPSNKVLYEDADVLLMALLPLLTSGNEEAMCEAACAVGNLARASPSVRAALCDSDSRQPGEQQGEAASPTAGASASASTGQHACAGPYVLQSLVLLLDHGSWDVVHSVAGALVNLAALSEAGTALSQVGLAAALSAALHRVQGVLSIDCSQHCDSQQQDEEEEQLCIQAAELLLQCVNNLVTASAAAMSEAVLGCAGARCAELACTSEDLASFSAVVRSLVDADDSCGSGHTGHTTVPACIRETAAQVQLHLTSLWGL